MNLLIKSKFAKWAGKSAPAVSKALKQGRLELFQDTDKINTGSPKSQAFKSTIGNGQKNIIPTVTGQVINPDAPEPNENLEKAGENVLNAQAQKTVEESALKKQQRIKEEIKNANRMGEVVRLNSINTMIMTWFDQWLSTNKRRFNGSVDEFLRLAFQLFENENESADHDISRATFKRKWATSFEQWQHEGNKETMKRLSEIQEGQAGK